jgi:glycosyltransferase involved in cell wall biosynthesis
VIDGGSTDNTLAVLSSYPHLRWISEPDRGQPDAMNKAFHLSTGDIIVYLNADDWFEPDVFKVVVDTFHKYPTIDIVVGNLFIVEHNRRTLHTPDINYREITLYYHYQFPLNPVSYFYKRRVQETVGEFAINNHYTRDYHFLLKAFHRFKARKIDLVMGNFYIHGHNKSGTSTSVNSLFDTTIEYFWQEDKWGFLYFLYHSPKKRKHLRRILANLKRNLFP